ncbi:MAG: nickel pincer cofactor biosynthesis protein LarC [Spirochaetaceae bacterium]|nr:nickel pincer cofactor biosynthesis protein LarC [Spirochaetaceae bacterium]
MKVLYFDCFSGISGDMTLGAMVDVGVPEKYLKEELQKLHIDEEFSVWFEKTQKMGITGTRAHVELKEQTHNHREKEDGHHHHHEHRNLHSISHIIEGSTISPRAKEWAIKIFREVAVAEAKVHGTTVDKVHFHEVGATDSIVDIVGAAICLDYLDVDRIMASKVEVGGGFIKCAHGTFPVPAPATTEILKGIPCTYGKVDSETTTPTGAAILAAMVDEFTGQPELTVDTIGYGLGYKNFEIPNVLRVMTGEMVQEGRGDYLRDRNLLIECNLDDMNSEDYQHIMDCLFKAGALDVYLTPIFMKKNRPASKVSILTDETHKDNCIAILFEHTSTFGLRISPVEKVMLKREIRIIETAYGPVNVKVELKDGTAGKWKMEYDDLRSLADKFNLSLRSLRLQLNDEVKGKL